MCVQLTQSWKYNKYKVVMTILKVPGAVKLTNKEVTLSSSDTLCSLAMLKVNIDSGGDYLEYLKPYVTEILANDCPEVVSDASISNKLRDSCGLEIPHRTIQIILQRLAKEQFLIKENGKFVLGKKPVSSDLSAERASASRHIAFIVSELVAYAAHSSGRKITDDVATECLVVFLSQFSIPCLRSYLRGTTLPNLERDGNWQVALVAQFVGEIQNQPAIFDAFVMLMQGHMLANALLCPDLSSVSDSYSEVIFYFDTPLLIQLLGLEGEQERQAIKEVVDLVSRLKGRVCYFTHTLDELTTSISSSADFVDSPRGRGTIVAEARKSGKTKSDLLLIGGRASEILEEYGVTPVATPSYTKENHRFEISEEAFSAVLSDEIDYHNPRAKDYDIRSVRSIYVLRKGSSPRSVEKAKAVLVTSNSSFSKAAYEYGKTFEMSREVSTVITDFSLANIAWLKAPQGAPALPKKEMLAYAYAAARPTKNFWDQVLNEADRLEKSGNLSARDHQLLRSSYSVQSELMKLTLGEEAALTEESITKTLKRVSDDILKEANDEKEKIEGELLKANSRADGLETSIEDMRKRIFWTSNAQAEKEAKWLSVVTWLSQAVIAAYGIYAVFNKESQFSWVYLVVAILAGAIRLIGTAWDIKPLKAGPAYVKWRADAIYRKRLSDIGLKDPEVLDCDKSMIS